MLKFFFAILSFMIFTSCDSKIEDPVIEKPLIENKANVSREEISKWIGNYGYQAVILYRRDINGEFEEISRVGPLASQLRRYVKEDSFYLFERENEVDEVVVILSEFQNKTSSGSISIAFRSVISGNVSLVNETNEIIVCKNMFLEAMNEYTAARK